MRKLLLGITLLFITLSNIPAEASAPRFALDLGGGYRRDHVDWTIAGPDGVPDVLSSLEWKNLKIWQVTGTVRWVTCDNLYIRAYGNYGHIYHGKNIDRDFEGDDETLEFSRSTANASKGHVWDASGGIGYMFSFVGRRVTIAPLIGYSHHEQHLHQYDLFLEIPPIGSIPDLNSNYRAKWRGPWVGVDMTLDTMCNCIQLFATAEYHFWGKFHAKGHWNLRPEFIKDFRQHAWAHGVLGTLGANYNFSRCWALTLAGTYIKWRSWSGHDRVFFAEGPADSRLNPVHWESWQFTGTVKYHF